MHLFYIPKDNIDGNNDVALPDDESQHALCVLRLGAGENVELTDGCGNFYKAVIEGKAGKRCIISIKETLAWQRPWDGRIHLAMAPTKNMDRNEWLAEKATEIGFDELTFLNCHFSERRVIKTERIRKILVSAMKQSQKALLPVLNEMTDFKGFINAPRQGQKFIAHCYEGEKPLLRDVVKHGEEATVMIGPEGDFSEDEVKLAVAAGWQPISLGRTRLRTETAALVAVHIINLINQ